MLIATVTFQSTVVWMMEVAEWGSNSVLEFLQCVEHEQASATVSDYKIHHHGSVLSLATILRQQSRRAIPRISEISL